MTSVKMAAMNRHLRPVGQGEPHRTRLICKRCGLVLDDCEPMSATGEFFHRKIEGRSCKNAGRSFHLDPKTHLPAKPAEVAVFMRKRLRRAEKRSTS